MRTTLAISLVTTAAALTGAVACADDSPSAAPEPRAFVSPVSDGYRLVGRPLAMIVRGGEGTEGAVNGFELFFRLNRAMPRRGTQRAELDGDSGFPAAMGVGVQRRHCYWQPIDGGPGPDAQGGDIVTVRVVLGGDRRPLTVRVPLTEQLPRIVNDDGLEVGHAPYLIRLGCASDKVNRWGREQGFR